MIELSWSLGTNTAQFCSKLGLQELRFPLSKTYDRRPQKHYPVPQSEGEYEQRLDPVVILRRYSALEAARLLDQDIIAGDQDTVPSVVL